MKKSILFFLLALPLLSLQAQSAMEIFIRNTTGEEITEIYLSSSASDFWGDNLLKEGTTLPASATLKVSLSAVEGDSRYDILASAKNGSRFQLFDQPVRNRATLILAAKHFSGKLDPAEKENLPEEVKESLTRKSGLPKQYIDGYRRGYLNGYGTGFQAGYEAAKSESDSKSSRRKK